MAKRKFEGKNSTQSSRSLFNERAKYHNDAVPQRVLDQYPGVFRNFWFIENMYYGKIDRQHRFLIVKPEKIKIVDNAKGNGIFLVDFAADAMSDFLDDYEKALSASKIRKDDEVLSSINAEAGYTSVLYEYDLHMNSLRNEAHSLIASNHANIEDFDDFVEFFLEHFYTNGKNTPLTLTGFIASRFSSLTTTGLFTDFTSLKYDKDEDKVAKLIDRPNYQFFIKNAAKYGFLIDYNIPWRVCANLGATEMERYMYKYGSTSQTIFEDYYDFTYTKDMGYLMNYLYKFYNRFVGLRPYIRREKISNDRGLQVHRYVDRRQRLTKEKLDRTYGDEYKLKLYVSIRNYETKNRYSSALVENIKENSISYLKTNDIDTANQYINNQFIGFLNDPYAYNGFVIRQEAKKNNQQMDGQDLQELLSDSVSDSRKTFY